jgi:hypothetical protein
MALQIAPIGGTLFSTGIGFNNGSIKSTGTAIRDSSNSSISYWINGGTHGTGFYLGTGTFTTGIDFGTATYSNAPIQFGAAYQGGGDRALCVSNSGGIFRGPDAACGGANVIDMGGAAGLYLSGGTPEVRPKTDNTGALGSATKRWNTLYTTAIQMSNYGGAGNRVVCVDNAGNTFRGASSSSC